MLSHLFIKNYILIENIEIDFEKGFSVITGETGAGKSIILSAVNFLLGAKADAKIIPINKDKSVVEAIFVNEKKSEIILRREINTNGRSRFFYNDEPKSLSDYKYLTTNFVDILSQHQSFLLNDDVFHQKLLDGISRNHVVLAAYKKNYLAWNKLKAELKECEESLYQNQREKDYITFQLEQLDKANLETVDLEKLETEAYQLRNSEAMKEAIFNVLQLLDKENSGVSSLLQKCDVKRYFPNIDSRISNIKIEIKDIVDELNRHYENTEADPQKLATTEENLNTINALLHKHNVKTVKDLISLRDDYKKRINAYDFRDEKMSTLKKQISEKEKSLSELAEELSISRNNNRDKVEKHIEGNLRKLGIPRARLEVKIIPISEFSQTGKDIVQIYFSANIDQPLKKISEVASGGEISRLMLCIKSLMVSIDEVQTIFFDEIDSGVSGQVALQIANMMDEIAQKRQVISITHLPQVASRAAEHYKVYKTESNGETHTHIKKLDEQGRINEIAEMLSGDDKQSVVIENAKFLLTKNKK